VKVAEKVPVKWASGGIFTNADTVVRALQGADDASGAGATLVVPDGVAGVSVFRRGVLRFRFETVLILNRAAAEGGAGPATRKEPGGCVVVEVQDVQRN